MVFDKNDEDDNDVPPPPPVKKPSARPQLRVVK
jgi:hypothetical protein